MAEILIQILIVIFSVLLIGGIIWTLLRRNPRELSMRRLVADKMHANDIKQI
nr:hypothetical protein [uncultured Campylobacter sp.]